ncbi:hypothetical protein PV328_010334 [Microctonus aethiopoides]|uniref:Mutator-like transposase domain-containing protein n=1 Tax=Microctonus aethiopoides TaxID=144406 RepID=A0AA39C7U4_9HYME|nr:hypothetical protein PV328_010334 [Microctonus aethiopoides]
MGWTTRGTRKNNDSLTGYSVLIGYFSKKVMAYDIRNRKCRICNGGHKPEDHDCSKNFQGTAKSMEPASAVIITCENRNLKDANMEIGVLIADNDSGTIAALHERCNHEVVKHSGMNHISKGVSNQLYELKQEKSYKELNNDSIKWIQRCFTYCVTKHDRNVDEIKKGLVNIPESAFNNHAKCDPSWCGYYKHNENYTHDVIGAGFKNENLHNDLKKMFQNLANNVLIRRANGSARGESPSSIVLLPSTQQD